MEKRGLIPGSKHSQITTFVILTVLMVVILGVIFFVKQGILDFGKEKISPEVYPIYSFVEDCIYETSEEGVNYVGQRGGYMVLPEPTPDLGIPYYLYEGKNFMPSKEQIEEQISLYVDNWVFFCFDDFIDFPDFDIKQGEMKTETKILDNKLVLNVEYPLTISKENKTYSFKKFNAEIPVRLGIIYNAVDEIMKEQMEDVSGICVNCLYDTAEKYGLEVYMLDSEDNETTLFVVRDENSVTYGEAYLFYFANKYEPIEL